MRRRMAARARSTPGIAGSQLDGPGLRAAGVDAAFWAIFAPGEVTEAHDAAATAGEVDALLTDYRAWIDGSDGYRLLLGPADIDAAAEAVQAGAGAPFGALLHLEGARGVAGLEHLRALHAGGLRSVGLTWNRANAYATGAFGDPATGLTLAGTELVRELNRLHMAIDGAHLTGGAYGMSWKRATRRSWSRTRAARRCMLTRATWRTTRCEPSRSAAASSASSTSTSSSRRLAQRSRWTRSWRTSITRWRWWGRIMWRWARTRGR